eukprot:Gb_41752 [translate_table: standard]
MANDSAEKCTDVVVSEANVPTDSHVVEIPVDQDHNPSDSLMAAENRSLPCSPAKPPQHPLEEIADSSGHLLLLKLWQREEEVLARRIEVKESRIDSIRKEVFQLACFYFAFHGIVLTLLFTASTQENADTCIRWWIPSGLSFITSLVLICAIQYKLLVQGKALRMLQRDKTDSRALSRCIQELRMKGVSFDLCKEPQTASSYLRASSLSVAKAFRSTTILASSDKSSTNNELWVAENGGSSHILDPNQGGVIAKTEDGGGYGVVNYVFVCYGSRTWRWIIEFYCTNRMVQSCADPSQEPWSAQCPAQRPIVEEAYTDDGCFSLQILSPILTADESVLC